MGALNEAARKDVIARRAVRVDRDIKYTLSVMKAAEPVVLALRRNLMSEEKRDRLMNAALTEIVASGDALLSAAVQGEAAPWARSVAQQISSTYVASDLSRGQAEFVRPKWGRLIAAIEDKGLVPAEFAEMDENTQIKLALCDGLSVLTAEIVKPWCFWKDEQPQVLADALFRRLVDYLFTDVANEFEHATPAVAARAISAMSGRIFRLAANEYGELFRRAQYEYSAANSSLGNQVGRDEVKQRWRETDVVEQVFLSTVGAYLHIFEMCAQLDQIAKFAPAHENKQGNQGARP